MRGRRQRRMAQPGSCDNVVSAETYYRAMFGARINTWNLRDERAAVGFIDARQKGKAILHLE